MNSARLWLTAAAFGLVTSALTACDDGAAPDFSGGDAVSSGGAPASAGGTPGSAGGAPAPVGGLPAPVGGTPAPVGGLPAPVGGTPGSAGGASAPVGGAPVGGAPTPREMRDVEGDASGVWCGDYRVVGPVTIPEGQTLTVCAGTHITVVGGPGAGLAVAGTLTLQGTPDAHVVIDGAAGWRGVRVGGLLVGTSFEVRGAATCLSTVTGGRVSATDALIEGCDQAMAMDGDVRLERSRVYDGQSIGVDSGVLTLIDTVVDFRRPVVGPDCIRWTGGGAQIEHSWITGCHCPLHFQRTDSAVSVTDSILDGATNPVMIAQTTAAFHRNNFTGTSAHLLDIGGGIACDVLDNYFEGAAARIGSGDQSQFSGTEGWRATPVPGAGPR